MIEIEDFVNGGRRAKSQLWSWTRASNLRMEQTSVGATGPNPTAVHSDERILDKCK